MKRQHSCQVQTCPWMSGEHGLPRFSNAHASNDVPLVNAAHKLLAQVNQTQHSTGKFNLQAEKVGTVIQGDHSHVVVYHTTPKAGQE